jgi:DNA helicase II / ATP-dependent DNA helicase PcrA
MAKVSAQQIYSLISSNSLTSEQAQIIESASLSSPSLVVAGAGSGKTELMMVRVMYLVANGFARPEEILGLTFTRKAANELRSRVQQGLLRLRESEYWDKALGDDFAPTKITTYNSFGNDIFRLHALEIGFESDSKLLTESLAIASVKELIEHSANPLLENYEGSLNSLAEKVLKAQSQLIDHQTSAEEVAGYLEDFVQTLTNLPKNDKGEVGLFSYTLDTLQKAQTARLIFELAGEFQVYKQQSSLFDYSDQVALSLRVGEFDKSILPFRFVMLDEYQDTSEIQTKLLSRLFANQPVMAVGDPNQSIYAWRGASSSNLADFFNDFGEGESFSLSVSWRSGEKILAVANQVASKIENKNVQSIKLAAGREISSTVEAEVFRTDADECEAVTRWIAAAHTAESKQAILFRTKDGMRRYADRLTELGIPHEITGLSSLLEQPEVADLISILRLLARPESSVDFLRIITGPRFRLGSADLVLLSQARQAISRIRKLPRNRSLTLLELVDQLELPSVRKQLVASDVAIERLKEFSAIVRGLRQASSLSLTELAWRVVEEFELDIELYAHSDQANPLSNLHSFIARISEFETTTERSSLVSLIAWLDYALVTESFELPKSGAKRGVVQLMSVHSAKGLEWDRVALPQMSVKNFPTDAKDLAGWLAGGILPQQFRLDQDSIPILRWHGITTQKEFAQRLEDYGSALKQHHLMQERRLAYVAITRAARDLFLTASHYQEKRKEPLVLSPYLEELIPNLVSVRAIADCPETKPQIAKTITLWPGDPLGLTRKQWQIAAQAALDAQPIELSEDIALLLKERLLRRNTQLPSLPLRLSASAVVKLLTNPEEFSALLARPTPNLFSEQAQLGTNFHANLEKAFLAGSELDFSHWSEDEKELGVSFVNSRFASLTPYLVEQTIEFPLAGSVIVCKLDAVYQMDDAYHIVDWKSGKEPAGNDLADKAIQLALYRIALSRHLGLGVERITAGFFFAASGIELQPNLPSEKELAERLASFRKAHLNQ